MSVSGFKFLLLFEMGRYYAVLRNEPNPIFGQVAGETKKCRLQAGMAGWKPRSRKDILTEFVSAFFGSGADPGRQQDRTVALLGGSFQFR